MARPSESQRGLAAILARAGITGAEYFHAGSAEDLARTCHAHPTFSEAVREAAMAAWWKPVHL